MLTLQKYPVKVDLFLDSIKSMKTRRVYDYVLKKFVIKAGIKDLGLAEPKEIERRKALLEKMKDRTLTPMENNELYDLLERERQEANSQGKVIVVLGLLLLLSMLGGRR